MKNAVLMGLVGLASIGYGQRAGILQASNVQKIGRGDVEWNANSVSLDDAYLVLDQDHQKDFTFQFEGRAPADVNNEEVGIWATFRHFDRNHRYVVGLRGEPHNDIYLARYAPDGEDRMLAIQPVPQVKPGEWATIKVTANGSEIRIFLNGQEKVVVDDASAPFKAGRVGVGGGYHPCEYRNVQFSTEVQDIAKVDAGEAFANGALKINFQPGNSPLPEGWVKDAGKRFDAKAGYGWAESVGVRDRKKTGNPLKDTLVTLAHDQTEAKFLLDVDPGEYLLTLHSGDQHKSSVNMNTTAGSSIRVTTSSGQFDLSHMHVNVGQDGQLVLDFSRKKDGAGTSLNWLVLEPRAELSEAKWTLGYQGVVTSPEKVALRKKQRAAYAPLNVPALGKGRSEVSLDGDWLFLPDYEFSKTEIPQSPDAADDEWHVMKVPDLWSPYAAWLFGETFPDMPYDKGASDSYYEYRHARVEAFTFNWEKTRSAWCRKHIELTEFPEGKHVELAFDAIAKVSHIYVNGEFIGKNYGMFGDIKLDITRYLKPGMNVIAVRVDDERDTIENGDEIIDVAISVEVTRKMLSALPYGMTRQDARGIWQPVKLVFTDAVKIDDVFVKPQLDGGDVEITLQNLGDAALEASPVVQVASVADGSQLVQAKAETCRLAAGETRVVNVTFKNVQPKLWSPADPNLYDFKVNALVAGKAMDSTTVRSGFKTFEVKGNKFYLNGQPYALRGANHCPNMLAPNDGELADRFMEIMNQNNLNATRFHGLPGTTPWMEAADRQGVLISYEGTWPWLMLRGPIPPQESIDIWMDEYERVIKRFRNHPSLALWTVNNEMKFHVWHKNAVRDGKADDADALARWKIVSESVKMIRDVDPTHPIVADSCYIRNKYWGFNKSPEALGIDDGDVDDKHGYFNWYNKSFFNLLDNPDGKGDPDRPLIGQEMSTGYYNGDSGHPVRAYLFAHQTPQSWVGSYAYEHCDPSIFYTRHAMLTKELAEYYRRDRRDDWAGSLIFGLVTWFKNQWLVDEIEPYPVVSDSLNHAMSPVLISARLTGRNVFAGDTFSVPVSIVNDAEDGKALAMGELKWSVVVDGKSLSSGSMKTPVVPYYSNQKNNLKLQMPKKLPKGRCDAQLHLGLMIDGKIVAKNHYALVLGHKEWSVAPAKKGMDKVYLVNATDEAKHLFRELGVQPRTVSNLEKVKLEKNDRLVINGKLSDSDASKLEALAKTGNGQVLWIHPKEQAKRLFPDQISNYRKQDGEVVTMLVPESKVFDGIEIGDMAWMGGARVERVPVSSLGGYHVNWKDADLTVLAEEMMAHGYLKSPKDKLKSWVTPLVKIQDEGSAPIILSEISVKAAAEDPIALRLWANLIKGE